MDVRDRVGRNVQRIRREREFTQEDVSHRANVHQTFLSGLENGKRNVSIVVLERIAKALNVDIAAFFEKH
jgi:transcriptional regulator with XRE-family HTH domain